MPQGNSRAKWTVSDYLLSFGFIGSFVTINSPIELVRLRMQVMPLLVEQGHLPSRYIGCIDCATRVYKNEGLRSFFKGNLSNLIRILPSQTLVWQLKEHLQRHFHYHHTLSESQHVKYNTIIGVSAALIVSLSLYPLEFIRQKLLNRTDRVGRSIWHYLKKTVKNQGVTGIYKGSFTWSLGLILFRGTYFGAYDSLKVKTRDEGLRWLVSALAVYMGILMGYPLDTVRRRLISAGGKYLNSRECFWDMWRSEGLRGFFLGWPMISVQSLSMATVFFCYDKLITDYSQAID